jgi:class 3 adenylate cyclase
MFIQENFKNINDSKIIKVGVLLLLTVIWTFIYWNLYDSKNEAREYALRENSNIALSISQQTLQIISTLDEATNRSVAFIKANKFDANELAKYAKETGLPDSILAQISYVDNQGIFVGSNIDPTGNKSGHPNLSERPHVKIHLNSTNQANPMLVNGLYIGETLIGKVSNKKTIQLSKNIQSDTNNQLGVIVTSVNASHFENIYKNIFLGDSASISLLGADGLIRVKELGGKVNEKNLTTQEFERNFLSLKDKKKGTFISRDSDGYENITAFSQIGDYPLFLLVNSNGSDIYINWKKTRNTTIFITVLLNIFILVGAFLMLRINKTLKESNLDLEIKVNHRTKQLELQTERTERLMMNILPQSIADKLKSGETVTESYSNVTILFSDIVGFTKMSLGKDPEEIVFLLNDLFKRFDIRALSLGLEKIKTIGDAYMVVGGLPIENNDHAILITKMAFGMYDDLEAFNKEHRLEFQMRIGINSGPVVAGVIGHSKFSYDLWGNAVNTASRMESTSIPGKVQVSPSTYEQIKSEFDVHENQLIECKGLGLVMTYFVTGIREYK